MKYSNLLQTQIKVSKICLGTMTFGEQNTQEEAFQQLNFAFEKGVNFIDTAEMYSVPMKAETYGRTEEIIGNWLQESGKRDNIVLATKASGPGPKHIRKGPKFTFDHLNEALNNSLKRLKTDYIDLYQLHWPERNSPRFGALHYQPNLEEEYTDFREILESLMYFIKAGKIRHIGISNETPWGMMKMIQIAEKFDLPKYVSIQNPYSLLNRVFEISHSEICERENVGLLAYSPLGGGLLSGKYRNNENPDGSRYNLFPNYFGRYKHPNTQIATEEYCKLAEENSLTPTQLALAFVNSRPFLTANIIGATTMQQLEENIHSIYIELSEEVLRKIDEIHFNYPNPAP